MGNAIRPAKKNVSISKVFKYELNYYTTLAIQIALWQSVISFTKITYHTAKIFCDFPCFYFMSF